MQEKRTMFSQMTLAILLSIIIVFSVHNFRSLVVAYTIPTDMENITTSIHKNVIPVADSNIFGNLAKQFGGFTKQFEYTVDLDGKQIFPNDTIKQNIVTNYKSADYNIPSLNYELLGFSITASDIKIHVNPSRIDQTMTKVDFPVVIAKNVHVTNGSINLKYGDVNLGSIYGIYNKNTDKMTMHIPIIVALRYLPHF
jgi:hypothetical protein